MTSLSRVGFLRPPRNSRQIWDSRRTLRAGARCSQNCPDSAWPMTAACWSRRITLCPRPTGTSHTSWQSTLWALSTRVTARPPTEPSGPLSTNSTATGSSWWTGYSFSWLGNLAARAHDGKKAEQALEIFSTAFTLRNSFHCNGDQSGKGYSKFTYRPFTLEGNFAAAAGIQEMLLQSHRGRILIFPAIPPSWQEVSFTTLRAGGAFLVSAKRTAGRTVLVEILSEKGGTCRLVSPFSGREIAIRMKPGEQVSLKADPVQ